MQSIWSSLKLFKVIVAVLSGYDIVKETKYAVELNVMNRGKIGWEGIIT